MKRMLLGAFSLLAVSAVAAPAVQAQTEPTQPPTLVQTTPFDVVNLARNGYFQAEGIPSHARLESAVAFGQITAEDVVRAAIEQNRVSPETLNDAGYLSAVELKLNSFHMN